MLRFSIGAVIGLSLVPFFVSAASCPNLSRNLSFGSKGAEVTQLQTFLIAQGHLAAGNNTGYYGKLTESAVKKFQCATLKICSGSPASNGWGSVGPKTRAAIKCPVVPSSPTSWPQQSNPVSGASSKGSTVSAVPAQSSAPQPVTSPTQPTAGPSVLSGAFDPVAWMHTDGGNGSLKVFGEVWDTAKKTWVDLAGVGEQPMKMLADYGAHQVYWHKDSSWQDFIGQVLAFDDASVRLRSETVANFSCADTNPPGGRCDQAGTWDARNDKFRLFVDTSDPTLPTNKTPGYFLSPRPVWNGWSHGIYPFDSYYCNSFAEFSTNTCTLYQKGGQLWVTVNFFSNYDIFNATGDGAVVMPNGTPEHRIYDVMIISIEYPSVDARVLPEGTPRAAARERYFYGRIGNTYYGLVRYDHAANVNGQYELLDRALSYGWDASYNPSFDELRERGAKLK